MMQEGTNTFWKKGSSVSTCAWCQRLPPSCGCLAGQNQPARGRRGRSAFGPGSAAPWLGVETHKWTWAGVQRGYLAAPRTELGIKEKPSKGSADEGVFLGNARIPLS